MQAELAASDTTGTIRILGVDEIPDSTDNYLMVQGRTIPWLQDVSAVNAWALWNVTQRDVVILDRENHRYAVFNLNPGTHDLQNAADYDSLKALLLRAATE